MWKKFRKPLIFSLIPILLLRMAFWIWPVNPVQQDRGLVQNAYPEVIRPADFSRQSLKAKVGPDKDLLADFEMAALVALSQYPELKEVKIEMVATQKNAPLESNFKWITLFGPKNERVYRVFINDNKQSKYGPYLLRNLPFNAQVGILAHEFGHVAYYEERSTLELIGFGALYLFNSEFRAAHERSTDLMPVYHGLGWQIADYAHYVRSCPACLPFYEEFGENMMDKYYRTDLEIKAELMVHRLYKDSL
jgi:hypothetical protein